ncbi:MAG: TonB-dependent receptor plug domain-containing protein, partial [Haliea sp.]
MMDTLNGKRYVASGAFFFTAMLAVNPTLAQLEEVIVTAERRQESLQDVPIAVTAFTNQKIESLKIENFQDLASQITGFSINSFSKSRNNPALRGGSSSLASAGAENAVGLFIDDVYFGGAGDFEIDVFDVERIEVLRGPQGTLFGRNTTGGLINVVTKDPGEEFEG